MNAQTRAALIASGIDPDAAESRTPVDLRAVPREEWTAYLGHPVAFPPDVEAYLSGTDRARLSHSEIDNIEIAMDRHYGTAPDFTLSLWPNGHAYLDPVKPTA